MIFFLERNLITLITSDAITNEENRVFVNRLKIVLWIPEILHVKMSRKLLKSLGMGIRLN